MESADELSNSFPMQTNLWRSGRAIPDFAKIWKAGSPSANRSEALQAPWPTPRTCATPHQSH